MTATMMNVEESLSSPGPAGKAAPKHPRQLSGTPTTAASTTTSATVSGHDDEMGYAGYWVQRRSASGRNLMMGAPPPSLHYQREETRRDVAALRSLGTSASSLSTRGSNPRAVSPYRQLQRKQSSRRRQRSFDDDEDDDKGRGEEYDDDGFDEERSGPSGPSGPSSFVGGRRGIYSRTPSASSLRSSAAGSTRSILVWHSLQMASPTTSSRSLMSNHSTANSSKPSKLQPNHQRSLTPQQPLHHGARMSHNNTTPMRAQTPQSYHLQQQQRHKEQMKEQEPQPILPSFSHKIPSLAVPSSAKDIPDAPSPSPSTSTTSSSPSRPAAVAAAVAAAARSSHLAAMTEEERKRYHEQQHELQLYQRAAQLAARRRQQRNSRNSPYTNRSSSAASSSSSDQGTALPSSLHKRSHHNEEEEGGLKPAALPQDPQEAQYRSRLEVPSPLRPQCQNASSVSAEAGSRCSETSSEHTPFHRQQRQPSPACDSSAPRTLRRSNSMGSQPMGIIKKDQRQAQEPRSRSHERLHASNGEATIASSLPASVTLPQEPSKKSKTKATTASSSKEKSSILNNLHSILTLQSRVKRRRDDDLLDHSELDGARGDILSKLNYSLRETEFAKVDLRTSDGDDKDDGKGSSNGGMETPSTSTSQCHKDYHVSLTPPKVDSSLGERAAPSSSAAAAALMLAKEASDLAIHTGEDTGAVVATASVLQDGGGRKSSRRTLPTVASSISMSSTGSSHNYTVSQPSLHVDNESEEIGRRESNVSSSNGSTLSPPPAKNNMTLRNRRVMTQRLKQQQQHATAATVAATPKALLESSLQEIVLDDITTDNLHLNRKRSISDSELLSTRAEELGPGEGDEMDGGSIEFSPNNSASSDGMDILPPPLEMQRTAADTAYAEAMQVLGSGGNALGPVLSSTYNNPHHNRRDEESARVNINGLRVVQAAQARAIDVQNGSRGGVGSMDELARVKQRALQGEGRTNESTNHNTERTTTSPVVDAKQRAMGVGSAPSSTRPSSRSDNGGVTDELTRAKQTAMGGVGTNDDKQTRRPDGTTDDLTRAKRGEGGELWEQRALRPGAVAVPGPRATSARTSTTVESRRQAALSVSRFVSSQLEQGAAERRRAMYGQDFGDSRPTGHRRLHSMDRASSKIDLPYSANGSSDGRPSSCAPALSDDMSKSSRLLRRGSESSLGGGDRISKEEAKNGGRFPPLRRYASDDDAVAKKNASYNDSFFDRSGNSFDNLATAAVSETNVDEFLATPIQAFVIDDDNDEDAVFAPPASPFRETSAGTSPSQRHRRRSDDWAETSTSRFEKRPSLGPRSASLSQVSSYRPSRFPMFAAEDGVRRRSVRSLTPDIDEDFSLGSEDAKIPANHGMIGVVRDAVPHGSDHGLRLEVGYNDIGNEHLVMATAVVHVAEKQDEGRRDESNEEEEKREETDPTLPPDIAEQVDAIAAPLEPLLPPPRTQAQQDGISMVSGESNDGEETSHVATIQGIPLLPGKKPISFSFMGRWLMYCAVLTVLVSFVVVSERRRISYRTNNTSWSEVHYPTAAPTLTGAPTADFSLLYQALLSYSGAEALDAEDSPQSKALQWMVLEDGVGLDAGLVAPDPVGGELPRFVQRYILAVLYFATSPWTFEDADGWLDPYQHECDWTGVLCRASFGAQRNDVIELDLSRYGLRNMLPSEIGLLNNMESLILTDNRIAGRLPPALGNIESLVRLELAGNALSGSLPPSIGDGINLAVLDLSRNRLTGRLPEELFLLHGLESLDLSSNKFGGTVSHSLASMKRLAKLNLARNDFTGSLPPFIDLNRLAYVHLDHNLFSSFDDGIGDFILRTEEFTASNNRLAGSFSLDSGSGVSNVFIRGSLARNGVGGNIRKLDLSGNRLNGTVSPRVFESPHLEYLDLSRNGFAGSLPKLGTARDTLVYINLSENKLTDNGDADFDSPKLVYLDLHQNELKVVPKIMNATSLEYLDLSTNDFGGQLLLPFTALRSLKHLLLRGCNLEGTIPAEIDSLTLLNVLDLRYNRLHGDIPPEMANLAILEELYLSNTALNGTVPENLCALERLKTLEVDEAVTCQCCD